MEDILQGIAVDAAHSQKNKCTEIQGVDLSTGEIIFYENLGNQTVNIGEFLALVKGIKYIIRNNIKPMLIYSDSLTAISWVRNKNTASDKRNKHLQKAEIYLKACAIKVDKVTIKHWNGKIWGENPADFNRK